MTKTETCRLAVRDGRANVLVAGGVMTEERFWQLYRDTVRALQGKPAPEIFIADFRRPIWALREHDLNEHLEGARPAVAVPAALIVAPGALDLFRGHAWSVAQAGILRKIFTCPAAAQQWALEWQRRQTRQTAP